MFEYIGSGIIRIKDTQTKIEVSARPVYSNYSNHYITEDKYNYPERFWDWVTRIKKDIFSLIPPLHPTFSFFNIDIRRFLNG